MKERIKVEKVEYPISVTLELNITCTFVTV